MAGFAWLLPFLGQPAEVTRLAIPFYLIYILTIPFYLVFLTGKHFLEGMGEPRPAMTIIILGNLFNVGLNYLLIYGIWIFPEWGLLGAAWATLISRSGMLFAMIGYWWHRRDLHPYIVKWRKIDFSGSAARAYLNIGLPIGGQHILEVGIFSAGAIMVGWFGAIPLAAHNIAITLASITYMAATGIAASATIQTSQAMGRKDWSQIRVIAKSGLLLAVMFMGSCALVFALFRHFLPYIFIRETEVIELAAQLLIVAAFFQLFDGLQLTTLGILRGLHDVKIPMFIILVSYWIFAFPLSYLFSVKLELGAHGVWLGYLIGLAVVSVGLIGRYYHIIKKIDPVN